MEKNNRCYIGLGFDSHSFGTTGTLVLGGVLFRGTPRLKGHSDGDALLHAVIDALLGAAGLGDIGEMFPDTKKEIKGISSVVMLKKVLAEVHRHKFRVGNVDITVVADRPRLSPFKAKMRQTLAPLLGVPAARVNIKGKTSEGINLFKKPGGVAVWAAATIYSRK